MYIESKQALAEELELKRPAVLAVSGVHNSGKTTLLEKLLPVLRSRGLKVGIIKHDGHDFTPDVPGTDSFRLREAGAEGVAVYSGTRYLLTEEFRLTEQYEIGYFLIRNENIVRWNVNVKPCAYEMSAAFLLYKKMPLPENELFKKNGNRI